MKAQFVIKYASMGYVYKLDRYNMIMQTSNLDKCKRFPSRSSAQAFIDKWDGAGVGLAAKYCSIEELGAQS